MVNLGIGLLILAAVYCACRVIFQKRHKCHCVGCKFAGQCKKKDA